MWKDFVNKYAHSSWKKLPSGFDLELILMRGQVLVILGVLGLASCQESTSVRWSDEDLFNYGMLAGGFVSLIGFMAAFLLLGLRKCIPEQIYTVIIQLLFACSCGALLGETMLHVLPQAYASRYVRDQQVSLIFIAAILSFVLLERFMHRLGISHSHWTEEGEQQSHHVAEKRQLKGKQPVKEATGFLNLISSLLHNFIDGLAIGLAFSLGNPSQFVPITVGIIAHEIPREMGDVAILLKSRFNEKETILSNGIVNLISLVGVYLGLTSHSLSPTTKQYALVFVAGNFMYIASDIWKNLFHHRNFFVNVLEMVGLLGGIGLTLGHHH